MSDIARQVGIHWRTAKRYADQSNWNASLGKRKSSSPVMGPYMEMVDTWLEEDQLLPHTGVRIFQRLKAEHAFTRATNGSVLRQAAEGQNGLGTSKNV